MGSGCRSRRPREARFGGWLNEHLGNQASANLTSGGATEEGLSLLQPKLVADNHPIQVRADQDGDFHLRASLLKVANAAINRIRSE